MKLFFVMYGKSQDCYRCINQPENTTDLLSCGDSNECNTCSINPTHHNNFRRRDEEDLCLEMKYWI